MKRFVYILAVLILSGCSSGRKTTQGSESTTEAVEAAIREVVEVETDLSIASENTTQADDGETTVISEVIEEFNAEGALTVRSTRVIDRVKSSGSKATATTKTTALIKSRDVIDGEVSIDSTKVVVTQAGQGLSAWQEVRLKLFNWMLAITVLTIIIRFRKTIWQIALKILGL